MMLVFKKMCGEISLEAYTKTPGTCTLYIYNCNKIVELNINHHKIMEPNISYVYIRLPFGAGRIFFLQVMPHEPTKTLLMELKSCSYVDSNYDFEYGEKGFDMALY